MFWGEGVLLTKLFGEVLSNKNQQKNREMHIFKNIDKSSQASMNKV